jgi:hypothetical protein
MLGFVLSSWFGANTLFTRSDTMREVMDRISRQKIKDFLNKVGGAFFIACFHIEVSNNGEVQSVGLLRRSRPATGVMLVIPYTRVTDGLEQRRRSTVCLFERGAAGFENSSRVKVRHKN